MLFLPSRIQLLTVFEHVQHHSAGCVAVAQADAFSIRPSMRAAVAALVAFQRACVLIQIRASIAHSAAVIIRCTRSRNLQPQRK